MTSKDPASVLFLPHSLSSALLFLHFSVSVAVRTSSMKPVLCRLARMVFVSPLVRPGQIRIEIS